MVLARQTIAELVRALSVLALIFLNFAVVAPPASAASGFAALHHGASTVAAVSFCGDPIDQHAGHAPCHACRSGTIALPPPPTDATRAFAVAAPVVYVAITLPQGPSIPPYAGTARAPPVAV